MKKLESRKTQISNKTTEIRNKNLWINFRNRTILLSNIGGNPSKQVEPKDNATEVCEGIARRKMKISVSERLVNNFKKCYASKEECTNIDSVPRYFSSHKR